MIIDPEDKKILEGMAGRRSRRNTRVLCLSSDWSSELMWTFYANNHRGICLCFDAHHDFFKTAKPVLYTHAPTDVVHLAAADGTVDRLAFCKSVAWQFQKEWRIVYPDVEPKKVQFPKESLVAVILGYRFPEPSFNDLKDVLIKHGYRVDVFRIERVPNSFELKLLNTGRITPA